MALSDERTRGLQVEDKVEFGLAALPEYRSVAHRAGPCLRNHQHVGTDRGSWVRSKQALPQPMGWNGNAGSALAWQEMARARPPLESARSLIQPCSSHSRMAPASSRTHVAHPSVWNFTNILLMSAPCSQYQTIAPNCSPPLTIWSLSRTVSRCT
jgi:hypothetical protein